MTVVDLNEQQFKYPTSPDDPDVPSGIRSGFDRVHSVYGSGNVDALFHGAVTVPAPWPRAGRQKHVPLWDKDLVTEELRRPPVLSEVDPRNLHSTQPTVMRHHVSYYMDSPDYRTTGRTAADEHNVGNQYPMVYVDRRGRNILLSGHHRATTALLRGEPLRTRITRER